MNSIEMPIAKQKEAKHTKISLFKSKEEMGARDYICNYALEFLAILFWVYTICKVLIFDIDVWVAQNFFPDHIWILNFKLIFVLGLISSVWVLTSTLDVVIWFLYITFYPLVIILWKLPYFVFKQKSWLLAFAVLNSIASFFRNLKYTLVFSTVFLTAFSFAVFSHSKASLSIGVALLLILILTAYVKSFITALKPSVVFQIYSKFFRGARKLGYSSFALDPEIKNLSVNQMEPKQLEKWNANLQSSVLFNRICLFIATRLRDYQKSEWKVVPSIVGLLGLITLTVVSFSGIYFALFKINTSSFVFTEAPTYFTFFYFSFNTQVFNSVSGVIPHPLLPQIVYMLQMSLSLILGLIIVTLYISNRTQRSSSELDEVISAVSEEAKNMEFFIQEEYKIPDINSAIESLKEAKSGLLQIIFWFSKGIR